MRKELTNPQWDRIKSFFPDRNGERGRPSKKHRLMSNAVLCIIRTGYQWRDLPSRYGSWKNVYTRFRRWYILNLCRKIFAHISKNNNNESSMIDNTIIKVHQHASETKGDHYLETIGMAVVGLLQRFIF